MKKKMMRNNEMELNVRKSDDIISLTELSALVGEMKEKDILKKHKYAITHLDNGNYCTHVMTSRGVTRTLTRSTKKRIEQAIIDFYTSERFNPCFGKVLTMWLEEKHDYEEIAESSYTKYKTDFRRYFPFDGEFYHLRIGDIDESILERYIKETIRNLGLTRRGYNAMRTLLYGAFKYAKREKMTDFSISTFFKDLALPKRIFAYKANPIDEEQVFTEHEANLVIEHLKQNGDIRSLGLILMFETGMRVGELVALRRVNLLGNAIEITSTEISYDDENGKRIFTVQDMPKTVNGHRLIYLTEKAQETVRAILKINPFGEYLFMDEGKRIRSKSMNYHIKKACREVGIPERSTHKMRKTYASMLIKNNVDERLVMQQMGHSDISTTKKYYYFNTTEKDEAREIITRAITY